MRKPAAEPAAEVADFRVEALRHGSFPATQKHLHRIAPVPLARRSNISGDIPERCRSAAADRGAIRYVNTFTARAMTSPRMPSETIA